ncbi:helicase C-terminal domain-containing protein [uncultured Campylobacter sp.]|uniref:helicase C-terminal domain-containing protein n=1 Tax=uncultured Campylobacter sp. TaxID=218934 RepID=UPI0034274769
MAYAISIHKSQGLEYDSVKIVITREIEENISHNIFYTAITRAKKYLKNLLVTRGTTIHNKKF